MLYTWKRLTKAAIDAPRDNGIEQERATAVTTDTTAAQKAAILVHTDMEWVPRFCQVMELVCNGKLRATDIPCHTNVARSL